MAGKVSGKSAYSDEEKAKTVEQVLALMAEGKTVRDATEQLKLSVTAGTVRRWMGEREEWAEQYQKSKKWLAQALADEAIQIARESTNHSSAADRVLIETLKWAAAKANPAEYGERQTVDHQGAQTIAVKIVEEDAPKTLLNTASNTASKAISAPKILNTLDKRHAVETAILAHTTQPVLANPD